VIRLGPRCHELLVVDLGCRTRSLEQRNVEEGAHGTELQCRIPRSFAARRSQRSAQGSLIPYHDAMIALPNASERALMIEWSG
jgi:hypothetical protein